MTRRCSWTCLWLAALCGAAAIGAGGSSGHASASPAGQRVATLRTFAGHWAGHTRSLRIDRRGRAVEVVYDGCCTHVVDLRFRLTRVRGSDDAATARATITRVRVFAPDELTPAPRVGQVGVLRLRAGVIQEPFLKTNYCNDTAGAAGTCGA